MKNRRGSDRQAGEQLAPPRGRQEDLLLPVQHVELEGPEIRGHVIHVEPVLGSQRAVEAQALQDAWLRGGLDRKDVFALTAA